MNPTVSVVIPTFNRAHIIGRAIEAVLNQTYPILEIVVMDDGSTDSTKEIVSKYPKVQYYCQKNQGAAQARNNGVTVAKGDFIAFLDSDDVWVTRKLEYQIKTILKIQTPILGARKKYIPDNQPVSLQNQPINPGFHYINFRKQMKRTWFVPSTIIIRKDYFQSFIGFDPGLKIAEDWDLWLKMAYEHPIPRMNAVLTYNFVTTGSLSENRLEKYLYDLKVIKKWDPRINNKISISLYKNWCISFVLTRLFKLYRHSDPEQLIGFWNDASAQLPLPSLFKQIICFFLDKK